MLDWGTDAQAGGVGERSLGISRIYSMVSRSLTSKQIKSGRDRLNQSVVDKSQTKSEEVRNLEKRITEKISTPQYC